MKNEIGKKRAAVVALLLGSLVAFALSFAVTSGGFPFWTLILIGLMTGLAYGVALYLIRKNSDSDGHAQYLEIHIDRLKNKQKREL